MKSTLEERPPGPEASATSPEREPRPVRPHRREPRRSPWRQRLVDLERGVVLGLRTDGSLHTLLFGSAAAVVAGLVVGLSLTHWIGVTIAVSVAFVAGMFHQVVKRLCHVIAPPDEERDTPEDSAVALASVREIVRMSAVAVWFATFGGGIAVLLVFVDHLWPLFRG